MLGRISVERSPKLVRACSNEVSARFRWSPGCASYRTRWSWIGLDRSHFVRCDVGTAPPRDYDRRVNPRHRRLIIPAALVALLLIVLVTSLVK